MATSLYLYQLIRTDKIAKGDYKSCIVCAPSEEEARTIHPCKYVSANSEASYGWTTTRLDAGVRSFGWIPAQDTSKLTVKYLGTADATLEQGMISNSRELLFLVDE